MRVRILSRASDLARLQAMLVGRALQTRWSDIQTDFVTRTAAGDRDGETPLAGLPDKGAFTADLSDTLASGHADVVAHSWKDLPLEGRPGTVVAATLERADPRDVLLVRRDVVADRPRVLQVLSSSPRRTWLLQHALPELLPWRLDAVSAAPVRGNVPTRLARLLEGRGHALVVAKAALDRLLGFGSPFEQAASAVRNALDRCHWMVLPLRDVPGAPAQGAIAVEAATTAVALRERLAAISHAATWTAVMKERDVLAAHGGGCHEAVGATVLPRDYGCVISVRAQTTSGSREERWSLVDAGPPPPRVSSARLWPRPDERDRAERRPLDVAAPPDSRGYLVARADALPDSWRVTPDRLVWAAGGRTWRRLAARGIWVHGCAEGLGGHERPAIDDLAGRSVEWLRLTHQAAAEPGALATYVVDETLPADLASRTHFFWTSGRLFLDALARWPELGDRWHGSGPGRTSHVLRETVRPRDHARVWLDYEQWYEEVIA